MLPRQCEQFRKCVAVECISLATHPIIIIWPQHMRRDYITDEWAGFSSDRVSGFQGYSSDFARKMLPRCPKMGNFSGKLVITSELGHTRPDQPPRVRTWDGTGSVWWSIYLTFLNCFWMKVPAFNWSQIKTNHFSAAMSIFTINLNVEKNGPIIIIKLN